MSYPSDIDSLCKVISLVEDNICIAGVDEAGRGCIAGPVVAAAVMFDYAQVESQKILSLVKDSKVISAKKRKELFELIQRQALCFAIAEVSSEEIDCINILQASLKAMSIAVKKLTTKPEVVLIDGNKLPPLAGYQQIAIVDGDAKCPVISAASILAKVARDHIMLELDTVYPAFGFAVHKGYPTALHLNALENHGITPFHRFSFKPVKKMASCLLNRPNSLF